MDAESPRCGRHVSATCPIVGLVLRAISDTMYSISAFGSTCILPLGCPAMGDGGSQLESSSGLAYPVRSSVHAIMREYNRPSLRNVMSVWEIRRIITTEGFLHPPSIHWAVFAQSGFFRFLCYYFYVSKGNNKNDFRLKSPCSRIVIVVDLVRYLT